MLYLRHGGSTGFGGGGIGNLRQQALQQQVTGQQMMPPSPAFLGVEQVNPQAIRPPQMMGQAARQWSGLAGAPGGPQAPVGPLPTSLPNPGGYGRPEKPEDIARGQQDLARARQLQQLGSQMTGQQAMVERIQPQIQPMSLPYGGGAGFAKPLSPNPGTQGQGGGGGGAPGNWKMSIEPMAYGGVVPGYENGGMMMMGGMGGGGGGLFPGVRDREEEANRSLFDAVQDLRRAREREEGYPGLPDSLGGDREFSLEDAIAAAEAGTLGQPPTDVEIPLRRPSAPRPKPPLPHAPGITEQDKRDWGMLPSEVVLDDPMMSDPALSEQVDLIDPSGYSAEVAEVAPETYRHFMQSQHPGASGRWEESPVRDWQIADAESVRKALEGIPQEEPQSKQFFEVPYRDVESPEFQIQDIDPMAAPGVGMTTPMGPGIVNYDKHLDEIETLDRPLSGPRGQSSAHRVLESIANRDLTASELGIGDRIKYGDTDRDYPYGVEYLSEVDDLGLSPLEAERLLRSPEERLGEFGGISDPRFRNIRAYEALEAPGVEALSRLSPADLDSISLAQGFAGQQRATGGIISLRGGGYVPMVYANGGYIPGYGFGGWLKKMGKGIGKLALKAAPIALGAINPLLGAGAGALISGIKNKSLKSALVGGLSGYLGGKALKGGLSAAGGIGNLLKGKGLGKAGSAALGYLNDPKKLSMVYPMMGNLMGQVEAEKQQQQGQGQLPQGAQVQSMGAVPGGAPIMPQSAQPGWEGAQQGAQGFAGVPRAYGGVIPGYQFGGEMGFETGPGFEDMYQPYQPYTPQQAPTMPTAAPASDRGSASQPPGGYVGPGGQGGLGGGEGGPDMGTGGMGGIEEALPATGYNPMTGQGYVGPGGATQEPAQLPQGAGLADTSGGPQIGEGGRAAVAAKFGGQVPESLQDPAAMMRYMAEQGIPLQGYEGGAQAGVGVSDSGGVPQPDLNQQFGGAMPGEEGGEDEDGGEETNTAGTDWDFRHGPGVEGTGIIGGGGRPTQAAPVMPQQQAPQQQAPQQQAPIMPGSATGTTGPAGPIEPSHADYVAGFHRETERLTGPSADSAPVGLNPMTPTSTAGLSPQQQDFINRFSPQPPTSAAKGGLIPGYQEGGAPSLIPSAAPVDGPPKEAVQILEAMIRGNMPPDAEFIQAIEEAFPGLREEVTNKLRNETIRQGGKEGIITEGYIPPFADGQPESSGAVDDRLAISKDDLVKADFDQRLAEGGDIAPVAALAAGEYIATEDQTSKSTAEGMVQAAMAVAEQSPGLSGPPLWDAFTDTLDIVNEGQKNA